MQNADNYTIREIGIPSMVLMERAALQAVEIMTAKAVDFANLLIVCGSGNNGGDGFAIARLIYQKGYPVTVWFVGKESSLSADCRRQKEIAGKLGISIVTTIEDNQYTGIVDALFGVGLNRGISGDYYETIKKMNQMTGTKIAIDIPSGISALTGQVLEIAFVADLTISFQCEKAGTVLHPGGQYAGKVVTADIGIITSQFKNDANVCFTYEAKDIHERMPVRKPNSHKGTYGKVLMISGSKGMSGAAFLSAKAAYMVGAGLVQIYTPQENLTALQSLLPEAILTTYTQYDPAELERLLSWADVVCIGCGIGQSQTAEQLLVETLKKIKGPVIIDADGINLLARHKELLTDMAYPCILTPHMKEMSGLLECDIAKLTAERFDIVGEFVSNYPVVCVLKDARTIVSKQDTPVFINTAGNNAMAKAGSGDVLAGVITGLLAQHMDAFDSACLGVYLHGAGGDAARRQNGVYSVLATDLIDGIKECLTRS